ncbi:M36 family metallopeptidase [Fontivita pretiosa]|uniref:M36 family metallopeptidase n=1 Tax=Fontivita pretiosa TaxID=2989684 RepID=UPI003D18257F
MKPLIRRRARLAMRCHALGSCPGSLEHLEPRRLLAAAAAQVTELNRVVDADGELLIANPWPQRYTLARPGQALGAPARGRPLDIALSYLRANARQLGVSPAEFATPFVTDQYTDSLTGLTHIYLRQEFNNLPVLNADMVVNVMRDGRILSVAGGFVPGLAQRELARDVATVVSPKLEAARAVTIAAQQLGLRSAAAPAKLRLLSRATGPDRLTTFAASDLSLDPVPARLVYVPLKRGDDVQLAWDITLRTADGQHWYNVAVSDSQQQIVFASDWVDRASYHVLAAPTRSPADGPASPNRTIVVDPHDVLASPYGWHDTNGVPGAEFTNTVGNNVSAQEDGDANNSGGLRPSGGASLNFDFPLDLSLAPASYQAASITNLFYWNNLVHDISYRYGFTEVAGNFQTNTYGRGGSGNDAVQADAQDGGGTNNANFATPPDGFAPRMQMYLFTSPNPDRDGSLDNMIIVHEYGHGISNRLTGGPANANALNATQSGGMGEGWSDWFGLMLTMKSTDTQNAAYPVGTYVLNQNPVTGAGIRRFPYSFNMSINPLTIDAYGSSGSGGGTTRSFEVHDTGEIWCSVLWDMTWLLINKYGFTSNLAGGFDPNNIAGNTLAMQLVIDAMKIQPANPSFKDARDAILQADLNLHASLGTPLNQDEIWQAFARRGMGASFFTPGADSLSVTPAFDLPVPDPRIIRTSVPLTGISLVPVGSITLSFNQAMNTASFSIADDVLSFTGPGSSNLKPTISGFAWVDNATLRLDFAPTSTVGSYTLVLGPDILAADNNAPMDQDADQIPGESIDDRFTLNFSFRTTLGPEGFGYEATVYPFENIDLVPGSSGVVTLIDSQDDWSTALNLGANTFNFYGVTYSGSGQMFVSSNGLITFGSLNSEYQNTDLASLPSQRAIAVLWDDLVTNRTSGASGAGNDTVLYRFESTSGDATPERLVIEWSNVFPYSSSNSSLSFQAILELNTGGRPGRIILNYPDLDAQNPTYNNGGSATEGIKDSGPQGARRLLLANDDGNFPWISSGKAVLFATDISAPLISAETYNYLTGPSLSLTFSEDVSASLSPADLLLENLTTGTTIPAANLSLVYNTATQSATLTFPGYSNGVLPNGNYRLTVFASGVTDAAGNPLDGNGDGQPGGNHTFDFFVLAADANRDRTVNIADLYPLASNWLQSGRNFAQGDYNYDGTVDRADMDILSLNWQTTLPPAPQPIQGQEAVANLQTATTSQPAPATVRRMTETRVVGGVLPVSRPVPMSRTGAMFSESPIHRAAESSRLTSETADSLWPLL